VKTSSSCGRLCVVVVAAVTVVCYSASSEPSISVSSHLDDEDMQQLRKTMKQTLARLTRSVYLIFHIFSYCILARGGSVAEWLACWTQAQMGLGSNRSRDAVG